VRVSESFGFLSTYPPTQCGLATFTASLAGRLAGDVPVGVVRVVDEVEFDSRPEVTHQWRTADPRAHRGVVEALNAYDVAVVQHEYGIFGGPDGESVVRVLEELQVPTIAVLHTVLSDPTHHQRAVLEAVVHHADTVVVMTETARRRLIDGYRVEPHRVVVIPHGAPTEWATSVDRPGPGLTPTILTWGLLGPGKGIEWAITAVASLRDLSPPPRYVVAGETHPRVLEHFGDAYRQDLQAQAATLGLADLVSFDDRYLDQASLRSLVMTADVVVLPYDSVDQVTSGVLTEAVTCRRPVVATAFPHAVELLSDGAGIIVPQRDAPAIERAVRRVLTEPGLAQSMTAASGRLAADLTWQAVADRYRALGRQLVLGSVPEVA
jgi:glycosyltransferase involved in cell wall biosynthesis